MPGEGGDRTPRPAHSERATAYGRLARLAEDLVVSAEANGTLVVVRTPPGAAHFLASAVDHADLAGVMGCIAGDDTILHIVRAGCSGEDLAEQLLDLTARRAADPTTPAQSDTREKP